MPLFDATNLSSPSEIVDSRANGEAVYSPTISNTSTINFADMVKEAARWKGAAINVDEALGEDKKARLAHSRITTKGDLDAYLMKKYGIDATVARSVSNELTDKNIPADRSAKAEEFANEPWAKTTGKDMDVSKVVTEEYEPYSRKNPGAGGNYTWKRVDKSKIGKIIKEVPELDYDDYTIDENAAYGQVEVTEFRPHEIEARKKRGIDINEKTKTAITDSFELAPDLRGKGLGRKLWQKIEDDARKHGAERMEIWHVMPDATGFWRKMGFKPIAGGSEDARTWVKEKEDFLPKAKKGTTVREGNSEYGDGEKVTRLVTKPLREAHKKLQDEIKDRLREKMEKVAAYDGWKWEIGDRVKSKKTGKVWEVTAKSWNDNKNVPTYYMRTRGVKDGEESGMFYAEPSHDAFIHLKGPISAVKEADAPYGEPAMADTFYSQMAQVLDKKLPNQGTPAQFRTMINAWAQKGEFKAEELKWSGVDEWLAGKKDRITKKDVVDFIKENQIQIKEITKDKPASYPGTNTTKYDSYQLPGGENYRELLLTLPERSTRTELDAEARKIAKRDGLDYDSLSEGEQRGYRRTAITEHGSDHDAKVNYHSSHWSEPNVLLHVRMNDRVDADGKRVLFLEEVQSDWHQEGRQKGYKRGEGEKPKAAVLERNDGKGFIAYDPHMQTPRTFATREEAHQAAEALGWEPVDGVVRPNGSVPQAPFSKTWHELGMKRMLRYAAENGYDRIAWTTGEQQAERYDLSKQLDAVEYSSHPSGYFIRATDKNDHGVLAQSYSAEELSQVVGKELTEKIVNGMGTETRPGRWGGMEKKLSGLDLKVGGEGMKGFYDKILPTFMNKYVKKWGSKVGETNIHAPTDFRGSAFGISPARDYQINDNRFVVVNMDNNNVAYGPADASECREWVRDAEGLKTRQTVHSVDITPQMRKEIVEKGQAFYEPKASYADKAIEQLGRIVNLYNAKGISGLGLFDRSKQSADRNAAGVRGKETRHHTVGKLVDDLKALKPVRLRGAEVKGWDDVYEALRITRNKNVEILQVLYIGEESGKILYNEACSSRLPGAVQIASPEILAAGIRSTTMKMERLSQENVRVVLAHNHPSGDVTASDADIAMTKNMAKLINRYGIQFDGHIVINHNKYNAISGKGDAVKRSITDVPAEHAKDPLLTIPIPHEKPGATLSRQDHVASIAKDINRGDKYFTILMRSGTKVRGIVNVELGILDDPQKATEYIKELMVNHGAQDSFVYCENFTRDQIETLVDLVKGNTLRDAAWEGERRTTSLLEQGIYPDSRKQFGKDIEDYQGDWLEGYDAEFQEERGEYGTETDSIIKEAKENGTYLKAPNGEPTKLNPGQWAQVRTKAFKEWFGDWENDPKNASKVVDENGEPLVMYHGTDADFDTFKDEDGIGMYFSPNPEHADAYADVKGRQNGPARGDNVKPVFLNIQNPARRHANLTEYDGIITRDAQGNMGFVAVFEPSQIKSATANRGTFDTNEGSILKDKDAPYGEDLDEPPFGDEDVSFDFGANVEKAIDENPEEYISLDFKDHLDGYMGSLQSLVIEGEAGKRAEVKDTGEPIWWSSTYPEFMQDQGWTQKEVLAALGHSIKGEEMTEKQRSIVQAAINQAVEMFYEDLQRWYPSLSGKQYDKADASIRRATDEFLSRYYTNQKLLKQEKEKADRATMITKSKYQWEKEKQRTENKAWEKGAKAVHAVQDPIIEKLQKDLDATVAQRDRLRESTYRLMNEAKAKAKETEKRDETALNEIRKLNNKIEKLKTSLEKARQNVKPKEPKKSTKALIRISTGQNLDDKVWISEYKLLTAQIRREAIAARQAFAAGNKKGLLETRARYKMLQAQQRAMREIRRETRKIIKDFKKVLKQTSEMTPEYADKIKSLLEDFDLAKMTGDTRLKLEAIREALIENPDADIDERTLDTLKRLEKIPIRNISYPGLKAMHDAVMHYATLGKRGPTMIMSQKKVTRDMILKRSIAGMKSAKEVSKEMADATYSGWKEAKARLAAAKDLYTIHLDTFDNLVESIAGMNSMVYRVLMREIKRGSNERDRIAYELEDDFMAAQEAFQKRHPEIKDVLGWLSEDVEFAGIKMNRNLALSLYRGWFDPDFQRSIIESGFGLWGSQDRDNPNKVFTVTGDAYGAAVNKLSKVEREYADLAIPTIQKSGDLLADKFLEINGYAMPRVEGGIYWRKEVLASERGQDEQQEQLKERFGRPYIFKGMTKKRTGSSAAVWLKPYTVAVREMHKRAADYVGLEEAMSNAAWLMYNKEFKSEIEARYGLPVWREMEKGLKDIAEISTPEAKGDMERFFRWLRNNSTIYALSANYGTMLKQLNGAFNYMVYVGPGYLARAISVYSSDPMAVKKLHRAMSVEYRRRRESGYSQDVGNVLQVINKQGTKPSAITRIGVGGLVPLQMMDIFGVDLGMLAATYQAMDAFKAGKMPDQMRTALDMTDAQVDRLTTAEKMDLAYRWADFVTERTQSQNVPEHMSGWQRGGELEKQLSMFFGELQKNLAGFARGCRAVKRGDPGAKALLLKTILLYAILGTAIDTGVNALRNLIRGRKGDKWWAELLKSFAGYLPGIREVVSGVVDMTQGKYYAGGGDTPYERVRNAAEKPFKATKGMITATTPKKRRENAKKFADGLANFVAMTVGIPYPAMKEPFRIANREEELRKQRAAERR